MPRKKAYKENEAPNIVERYCHGCGKYIYITNGDDWVYTRYLEHSKGQPRKLWFCSWTCMRKFDREREEARIQKRAAKKKVLKKKKPVPEGAVAPISELRTRYTVHKCGKCGKKIGVEMKVCKHCNTPIDWQICGEEDDG